MPVKNRFAEMQDEITGWRRHMHENPELMFDVHETAAKPSRQATPIRWIMWWFP